MYIHVSYWSVPLQCGLYDKAGIAANQDYGRDEDAAVKALKKHKVCTTYVWYL